ncbi:hypothetical protein [Streptomyces sp. NPDC051576]|uniref:hypothetical protein n=1 Tax=Streptomyces sp. NPDC051576 TaxID=3155803 RepID=UPI00343CF365
MRIKTGAALTATAALLILIAFVLRFAVLSADAGTSAREPLPREVTSQEGSVLRTAEQYLLRDCMRRHGFVYRPATGNIPVKPDFPYVIEDVAWARAHGYGTDIDRAIARLKEEDPNQRYFQSLPEERRREALAAANGSRMDLTVTTPDGARVSRSSEGCQAESERILYGNLDTWFKARSTMDALSVMASQRVLNDARFTAKVRAWAVCMRAAGHPYASPSDLRKHTAAQKPALSAFQERTLAMAEARCAGTSGLARTADALDEKYMGSLRRSHWTLAVAERRLRLAALRRARTILAANPTVGPTVPPSATASPGNRSASSSSRTS